VAIVPRGNVWQVQVRVGKDPRTGQWVRKSATADTREEAEKIERQLLVDAEADRARFVSPTRETLMQFADRWLEDRKRELRPATWERYNTLLRRHVLPVLGKTALPEVSPAAVERMLSNLSAGRGAAGEALSPRTVAFARAVLRAMLQDALRLGVVATNVVDRTRPPKQAPKQVTAFTMDEADALFAAAEGERIGALVRFAFWSGLRRGEALALKWTDLDIERGVVVVRRSYVQVKGRAYVQEATKTAAGWRSFTLPSAAIDALRSQKAQQARDRLGSGERWQDEGWVFTTGTGGLLFPSNVYRDFARLRDLAPCPGCKRQTSPTKAGGEAYRCRHCGREWEGGGLPRLPFHALRHSAVSVQLAAGVPLEIVSKKIGHKRVSLTADTYGHLLPEVDRSSAEAVDAFVARRKAARRAT